MKSKNLLLGIIILFVGIVSLLATFDVFDFSWRIAWKLWPMLLVFVGIAVLPVKDWLKAVLLVLALALGALLYHQEAEKQAERYPSSWVNKVQKWWGNLDSDVFDTF